jgi:hypothetical protein
MHILLKYQKLYSVLYNNNATATFMLIIINVTFLYVVYLTGTLMGTLLLSSGRIF